MEDALRLHFPTEEDLGKFAAEFARRLRPGDVVALGGPLGAGKTTFVRAVVRALHGTDQSCSPTFTFRHRYDGDPPIDHIDFYRIDDPRESAELGLEEALDGRSIALDRVVAQRAGGYSAAAVRNRNRRRRRRTTHALSSTAAMIVLALDGALGAFSDRAFARRADRRVAERSGRRRARTRPRAYVGDPRRSAHRAGTNRPPSGRGRPGRIHRPAHRDRLCEVAGRSLGASARTGRFLRSAGVRAQLRTRAERRRRPSRRHLGALS